MPRRIDMQGMSRKQWRERRFLMLRVYEPEVLRAAEIPKPVDLEQLKREAMAGRELMKEIT